jgi:hypothetical protein
VGLDLTPQLDIREAFEDGLGRRVRGHRVEVDRGGMNNVKPEAVSGTPEATAGILRGWSSSC